MSIRPPEEAPARKARGAYFTPPAVARYVTTWAVRHASDLVLEPSCGEAAFLLEAGRRLRALGQGESLAEQLHGTDVHAASVGVAAQRLAAEGIHARLVVGDFLASAPTERYDAVIGNPPFVRYQSFTGESRAAAKRAALRAGVTLSSLASSWAAFVVHAALHLKPGGRLGLVLPAEMLSVNYAAAVREFLMAQFARVRLVLFTERLFPGVMEDVVLVLAEGRGAGPSDHCELLHSRNGEGLAQLVEADVRRWAPTADQRWSAALLDRAAEPIYHRLLASPDVAPLHTWGETTLGMVTGNNAFFTLTSAQVTHRRLASADLVRLSPPGSRHLRHLELTAATLDSLDRADRPTWLFRPSGEPSAAGQRYIKEGRARGVDQAYKCRVRTPWWRVPYLRPADLLLTYMNADTARLCHNAAGVHHLNSVHGVYLREPCRELGLVLPLAALNTLSVLGAELVGRSYGGGVLKVEPREADRWPMPAPELVQRRRSRLLALRPHVHALLTAGQLADASRLVDEALWPASTFPPADQAVLAAARQALHDRRVARTRFR